MLHRFITAKSWRYLETARHLCRICALTGLMLVFLATPLVRSVGSGSVLSPEFHPPRGFYPDTMEVVLKSPSAYANIRYTLDGSRPANEHGLIYDGPILLSKSTVIRAACVRSGRSSPVNTHTYILNANDAQRAVPALCVTGDPKTSLFEPDGILGSSSAHLTGRATPFDGHANALGIGRLFERPVSVELIEPADNAGVQFHCGIRLHGSWLTRSDYLLDRAASSCRFSFKLLLRPDYYGSPAQYPFLLDGAAPRSTVLVARVQIAGAFIIDELTRRLHADCGRPASRGTFVNVFINGRYITYCNLCERIDEELLRAYYGTSGEWDVFNDNGVRNGDDFFWMELFRFLATHDLATDEEYDAFARLVDIENLIDYVIVRTYAKDSHFLAINWVAAHERKEDGKFEFLAWDAENTFLDVKSDSFDQLHAQDTDISVVFCALKRNPRFRAAFAERVNRHFSPGGALCEENVMRHFRDLCDSVSTAIPDFDASSVEAFIAARQDHYLAQLRARGLY